MHNEDDYVCFTCGGLFPFAFEHQVFSPNLYLSGIVICKSCMRGIAMNKKQRRANKKKAVIRQRRKDRNRRKQYDHLKNKEKGLDFMAEFMKLFQGMDLSSLEGDGEGESEMSEEDMQKVMAQFTDLLGGGLGDLPLDLGGVDFDFSEEDESPDSVPDESPDSAPDSAPDSSPDSAPDELGA